MKGGPADKSLADDSAGRPAGMSKISAVRPAVSRSLTPRAAVGDISRLIKLNLTIAWFSSPSHAWLARGLLYGAALAAMTIDAKPNPKPMSAHPRRTENRRFGDANGVTLRQNLRASVGRTAAGSTDDRNAAASTEPTIQEQSLAAVVKRISPFDIGGDFARTGCLLHPRPQGALAGAWRARGPTRRCRSERNCRPILASERGCRWQRCSSWRNC